METISNFKEDHGNTNQKTIDKHNRIGDVFATAFSNMSPRNLIVQNLIEDNCQYNDSSIVHLKDSSLYKISIDFQSKNDKKYIFEDLKERKIKLSQYIEKIYDKSIDLAVLFDGNQKVESMDDIENLEFIIAFHSDFGDEVVTMENNFEDHTVYRDCVLTDKYIVLKGMEGIRWFKNIICYSIRSKNYFNYNSFAYYNRNDFWDIDGGQAFPEGTYDVEIINMRYGMTGHRDEEKRHEQMVMHMRVISGDLAGYTFTVYNNTAVDLNNRYGNDYYRRDKIVNMLKNIYKGDSNIIIHYEDYKQFKNSIYPLHKKLAQKKFKLTFNRTSYGLIIIKSLVLN